MCDDWRIGSFFKKIGYQETAQLESDAFVQKQKVALAAEVKAVLDSWARFEQQQKESEQADLAKSVIAKVLSTVKDEKTQRDILNGAIAEVDRECSQLCFGGWCKDPDDLVSELVKSKAI